MTRTHHPTRRRLALALSFVGAVSVAAAACSGPAKQVAPTTIVITLPSTIAPATTAPATATVATSAPASTDASTSAASTTTTSAAPTPEQAVRAAWHGWIAAGEACTVDPKGCDRAALAQFMEPKPLAKKLESMDAIVALNRIVHLGTGTIEDRYKIEHIEVAGRTATVTYCEVDAGIMAERGAGPDGAEVVINDAVVSRRDSVRLTRSDAFGWRMAALEGHQQEAGRSLWDSCVAAS